MIFDLLENRRITFLEASDTQVLQNLKVSL